jgi:hypothetical protein
MLDEILGFILQLIFECLGELVLGFVWWIILLPILWMLSGPVILLLAAFSADPYWTSVFELFRTLNALWSDWGLRFLP